MKILFPLAILLLVLSKCVETKMVTDQSNSPYQKITLKTEDCAKDRKNKKTLSDVSGVVNIIANDYVIVCENPYSRYVACNMPEACNKENLQLVFSGIVKEIFPYERRYATPLLLQSIEIKD